MAMKTYRGEWSQLDLDGDHRPAELYVSEFNGPLINIDIADMNGSNLHRVNMYVTPQDALDLATLIMYKAQQAIDNKENQ